MDSQYNYRIGLFLIVTILVALVFALDGVVQLVAKHFTKKGEGDKAKVEVKKEVKNGRSIQTK